MQQPTTRWFSGAQQPMHLNLRAFSWYYNNTTVKPSSTSTNQILWQYDPPIPIQFWYTMCAVWNLCLWSFPSVAFRCKLLGILLSLSLFSLRQSRLAAFSQGLVVFFHLCCHFLFTQKLNNLIIRLFLVFFSSPSPIYRVGTSILLTFFP